MSDVCVDAMGARFGQAFLAEDAVLDHPEVDILPALKDGDS